MSLVQYVHNFLSSLFFTDVIETAILWVLIRYVVRNSRIATIDIIFAGLFASFATITYVWFVFPVIATWPKGNPTVWSEPFAFLVEALFYRMYLRLSWKNALAVSLICNIGSFIGGNALRMMGLWLYW